MRYSRDIKDKACEAAMKGVHLKQVQVDYGPNPKAVMRYLKKKGIDYKALKTELKPKTVIQINKERNYLKKQNKKKSAEPVVVSHDYLEN